MSCNIHSVLQVQGASGHWSTKVPPLVMRHRDTTLGDDHCYHYLKGLEPIWQQNYDLYAILADVRNDEKNPFDPISEPRGLPDDFYRWDDEPRCESSLVHLGDHSFSWLTAYDLVSPPERPGYWGQERNGETYKEAVPVMCEKIIPGLLLFAAKHQVELDRVRIVFGFDN